MFHRIFLTALVAGAIAGVCLFVAHLTITTPLILQAEVYENAAPNQTHGSATASQEAPADNVQRSLYSLMADLVTSMGFAFLLVGAIALSGRDVDWRRGLVWGLCGYASFSLAPTFGLAPEVPGMLSSALQERQVWWAATVVATASGLALMFLAERSAVKWIGPILIVLPHLIGVPEHETYSGDVPAALAAEFAVATLVIGGLFWLLLGALAGYFYDRFERDQPGA